MAVGGMDAPVTNGLFCEFFLRHCCLLPWNISLAALVSTTRSHTKLYKFTLWKAVVDVSRRRQRVE